jgi:adenylate kinase family enzyme
MLAFILSLALMSGCKSKKKAMEASNAEKERAKIEQEAMLRKQQQEEAQRREAEELAKREAEARLREKEIEAPRARLTNYFAAIATSSSVTSANNTITEALSMFASPDTPVLIVISEENGQKDYDRPTTIRDYLNYLKDQKKNINSISAIKVDGSGKITELELLKPL